MTTNPTFGIPSPKTALNDPKTGLIASVWYQFFTRSQQLTAERPIAQIAIGPSPFTYTASTIGSVIVIGGTVASLVLGRSGVTIDCAAAVRNFVPMAANDTITVTYSVLPTMTFVPSARG